MKLPLFALAALLIPASLRAQTVLVKPYVQPGNGSTLAGTDVKVIAWVTDQKPGDFVVEYAVTGGPMLTAKAERVALDFQPPKPAPAKAGAQSATPAAATPSLFSTTFAPKATPAPLARKVAARRGNNPSSFDCVPLAKPSGTSLRMTGGKNPARGSLRFFQQPAFFHPLGGARGPGGDGVVARAQAVAVAAGGVNVQLAGHLCVLQRE